MTMALDDSGWYLDVEIVIVKEGEPWEDRI